MFGIKFIRFDAMTYVMHFKNGQIKKEGRGLSFFYYAPNSSITAVPLGSKDIQFIFSESTKDFQTVTIQGQITYQIVTPKQLAELLDFNLVSERKSIEDNFGKINQRLNNEVQTAASAYVQSLSLKETIRSAEAICKKIEDGLKASNLIKILGVEILSINVLAVKPTPEMAKALETETREALQKEADQAIYERRNFAVEQERMISESELSTEIAVQEKRKQIQEKQAEIKIKEEENNRVLREMRIAADISVEEQRKTIIDMKVENDKKEADAKGYLIEKTLHPYKDIDWRTLMAMNGGNMDAKDNIAFAFRLLAENTSKIENLNISPELLTSLLNHKEVKKGQQER
jgi:hypothetical protein